MSESYIDGGEGFASIGSSEVGSALLNLLMCDAIVPGEPPSYQICKELYDFHPLGAKMAEVPVRIAQSQRRNIIVPGGPESRLVEAFNKEWDTVGGTGQTGVGISADVLIASLMRTCRVYGIATMVIGDRKNLDASAPLNIQKIYEAELFFNVLDPLNTAGSLVLNQDPNSADFQKPVSVVVSGDVRYHPSRALVMMNEQPMYLAYTASAFGFSGRSVYQRALFPMKTFVQSMITDDMVTKKVGLLIWNAVAPGSIISNRVLNFFGMKRQQLKGGMTGNVLTIGKDDLITSLNFQNLEGPAKFARDNCLRNIAMACGMPSKLLEQEEMVGGMAEGSEDAKQIAQYIDSVRMEMAPAYRLFDDVVRRRAWSPAFYETIKRDYDEYRSVPYETAFTAWYNAFSTKWPSLLSEPESEKIKVEETRFKSVVALVESLSPLLDPENRAALVSWAAEEINSRRELFSSPLYIDQKKLSEYTPPTDQVPEEKEEEPKPFGGTT